MALPASIAGLEEKSARNVRNRRDGSGVLLIEQFTHLALEIADHAHVVNRGRIRFDGSSAERKATPQLLEEACLVASA